MTKRGPVCIAALMLCLSLSGGCSIVERVARELSLLGAEEVQAPKVLPVSEREAKAFAAALSQAVDASDVEAVAALIDFDAMVRRALAGLKLPKRMLDPTTRGVTAGAKATGLAANIATQHARDATYTLIGTRRDRHGQHAVFRSLAAAGGVEHHDFLLSKKGKDVVAVDVYMLVAGELLSTGMRRLLMTQFAGVESVLEHVSPKENLFFQHRDAIQAAMRAMMEGKPEVAIKLIDALPEEVRHEKHILIARMSAANQANDDGRYEETLGTITRLFPGDAAAAVASIDRHFMKGEHDKMLAAIEAVAKASTPDAYFDVLRSMALVELNRLDDAKKAALLAIEREPTLHEGHFALLKVLLAQRDHAATSRQLLRMHEELGIEFAPEDMAEATDFVASPEWKQVLVKLEEGRPD